MYMCVCRLGYDKIASWCLWVAMDYVIWLGCLRGDCLIYLDSRLARKGKDSNYVLYEACMPIFLVMIGGLWAIGWDCYMWSLSHWMRLFMRPLIHFELSMVVVHIWDFGLICLPWGWSFWSPWGWASWNPRVVRMPWGWSVGTLWGWRVGTHVLDYDLYLGLIVWYRFGLNEFEPKGFYIY